MYVWVRCVVSFQQYKSTLIYETAQASFHDHGFYQCQIESLRARVSLKIYIYNYWIDFSF